MLLLATAAACSDAADVDPGVESDAHTPSENVTFAASAIVGVSNRALLANAGLIDVPMRGAYFFAGSGKGDPENYTQHPLDPRHLQWGDSQSARDFAVQQMVDANVNTIVMSYWGPPGTDNWHFAPMNTTPASHEELFASVQGKNVTIMPLIEEADGDCASYVQSPSMYFRQWFPAGVDQAGNPLLVRIKDLVNRFIKNPAHPEWARSFTKMYDRFGTARYMFDLLDVGSSQPGVTPAQFAAGFDRLADKVFQDTGVPIGFTIDPGQAFPAGDNSPKRCTAVPPLTYDANTSQTAAALAYSWSVVAVQPFLSQLNISFGPTSQYPQADRYTRMRAFKRDMIEMWAGAGVPYILDLTAGYHATIWDKDSPLPPPPSSLPYGNDDGWRNSESSLRKGQGRLTGVVFTAWNGLAEGWAGMPTVENNDSMYSWVQRTFSQDPRYCNHAQFVGGKFAFAIYGDICTKWQQMGSLRVPALTGPGFGVPNTGELPTPGGRGRYVQFENNTRAITWSPTGTPGHSSTNAVYGLIYAAYKKFGMDAAGGGLGLPVTDESASTFWCQGGRFNEFESGYIDYCPTARWGGDPAGTVLVYHQNRYDCVRPDGSVHYSCI